MGHHFVISDFLTEQTPEEMHETSWEVQGFTIKHRRDIVKNVICSMWKN